MAFRVEWHPQARDELRRFFSAKQQRTIIEKVLWFAENLPTTLSLKTVQPLRSAPRIPGGGRAFELDIGAGPRAIVVMVREPERVRVYVVGPHDYAHIHFLTALEERHF